MLPFAAAINVPVVSMGPTMLKEDVDAALFQELSAAPVIPAAAEETITPLLVTVTPGLIAISPAMARFAVALIVRSVVIANPALFVIPKLPAPLEPSIVTPVPLRVITPVVPLKVPFTERLPPTPIVRVAPANVAPELTVREELMTLSAFKVTVPALVAIITPPVPANVAGNSKPVVAVVLYASVALPPYVGTAETVAVPAIVSIPFTITVTVVIVLTPEPPRVRLE